MIKALSSEYPERAAEVLLAGAVTSFAEHVEENHAVRLQPDSILPKAALEFYDSTNVALTESSDNLDDIERIDRLTTIAEGRRNASLREIDRRRAPLGARLRQTVQEIEDAEFKVIEASAAKGKNAH